MAEPNKPFYLASRQQLQMYAEMSAQSRRSPELKKAWSEKEKIKERLAAGEWAKDIAEEYGIKVRQIYRIVNSDG